MKRSMKAMGIAFLVSGFALGATFAASAEIRRVALRSSHQQPTPVEWFEPVTRTSPALVAAGRKLFVHNCAHCHGFDATGDEGPDLHDVQTSDRYIVNLITRGMPHQMPSFAKKFSKDDDAALLAYVRSLEENQGT